MKTVNIQISSAEECGQDRRWENFMVLQSLSTGSLVGQLLNCNWLNVQSGHNKSSNRARVVLLMIKDSKKEDLGSKKNQIINDLIGMCLNSDCALVIKRSKRHSVSLFKLKKFIREGLLYLFYMDLYTYSE